MHSCRCKRYYGEDFTKKYNIEYREIEKRTIFIQRCIGLPGDRIDILRKGSGELTIDYAVGVVINGTPGLKLRAQWSSATLVKLDTDTWVALGDLKV